MSSAAEKRAYPVRFVWDHGGGEVHVCITSPSGESRTIALQRAAAGHHEVIVKLCVGRFEYRYSPPINLHMPSSRK